MSIDWFATRSIRRQAQEEANYALRDQGERADCVLRAKMSQTGKDDRRQICRLALKALEQAR